MLRQSEGRMTSAGIKDAVLKLDVGTRDALLLYAGRGQFGQGGQQNLVLSQGQVLERRELLDILADNRAKLTVLVTDCADAGMSPGYEVLPLTVPGLEPKLLYRLLFGQTGIVDIASCSPKQSAYCLLDEKGATGSIFMRSFFKECTLGPLAGVANPDWKAFMAELARSTSLTYRTERMPGLDPNSQPDQTPVGVTLKVVTDPPIQHDEPIPSGAVAP